MMHEGTADGFPGSLRLLTLNLWGVRGSWDQRGPMIAAELRRLGPDVIMFQESIVTDDYDQVAAVMGGDYHVLHHPRREDDGQGISIASRWPLQETHSLTHALSDRTAATGGGSTLIASTSAPDPIGPLLIANHFPSWQLDREYEREQEAVATAHILEDVAGRYDHVVVAGDLDAAPDSASVRFWTGRQSLDGASVCYRDAWESIKHETDGDTFTSWNPLVADSDWPFRRIDYILVRCGIHGGPTLTVRACDKVLDKPVGGVWASDHCGVMADLAVRRD